MISSKEVRFCSDCEEDTNHAVILIRKKSPFINEPNGPFKEFLSGFLSGTFLGGFVASMNEFDRHVICNGCGKKIVE